MLGNITITNIAESKVVIDIEGIIGIPENWQFENPEERVSTYDKFRESVKAINETAASDVVVNIRSTGGDVNDALLIHDALCSISAKITTTCYGYVASSATIIAQAASENFRQISANSLYLIHRSSITVQGNSKTIDDTKQILDKTDSLLASIYAKRSERPADGFLTLMSENSGNGRWLSASEALEYGLVDSVIDAVPINNLSVDDIKTLKLPDIPTDNSPINQNMKIKNTWTAILAFFGFDQSKENELTEAQLEKLNNELDNKQKSETTLLNEVKTITTQISEKDTQIATHVSDIATLRQKVSELEAENAKLNAKPTATEAKEDPAAQEPAKNPRVQAYEEDVKSFKS